MSDYVQLKNLQGQPLKPVTDLAAINMTTTNGIQVVPANGGTIGITSGYINSAYYVDMVSEDVGPASTSSAYIEGGTATLITGAYTVTSAINSSTPSQQKIPSEAAVVSALDNVVTSGTSYYAGTGIAIDAGHTVSVSGVPTSAVAGLDTQLTNINAAVAAKQDAISAGYRMSLDGTTLNQQRYFPVKDTGTSATITLEAGSAYKIQATTGSKTLTAETVSAGMFGLEGHAEIFIAGAGLIKTTSNVILAQPLEPDSVNNCTVRFHDGRAIISVEDHIAGHVVRSSGSGTESLKYWLETANTSDQATQYISVDASLDHTGLDFASATVNGEKHLVGNGYEVTSVGGMINCGTSKFTVSNLSLINTAITGGTLTLGDAFIPSGSTVAVSGGGLAIEKVTGDGGVIDLGGTNNVTVKGTTSFIGCIISGGSATNGGGVYVSGGATAILSSATLIGNSITNQGGGLYVAYGASAFVDHSTISGNYTAFTGGGVLVNENGYLRVNQSVISGNTAENAGADLFVFSETVSVHGSTIGSATLTSGGALRFSGDNRIDLIEPRSASAGNVGSVTLTSGATLDLTGNTNATPIAPGGGIMFEVGGATVQLGSTAGTVESSYMMDNITLPAGAKLTNTAVVDLGGKSVNVSSGATASISSCTITSGADATNGAITTTKATVSFDSVNITGNTANRGGVYINSGYTEFKNCFLSGNANVDVSATYGSALLSGGVCDLYEVDHGAEVILAGNVTVGRLTGRNVSSAGRFGSVTISSGAILDLTGNTNTTPIYPGGGITFEQGGATVLYSSGAVSGSYMMDNVTLPAGAKLTNTAVVSFSAVSVNGRTTTASGVTFETEQNGFQMYGDSTAMNFADCVFSGTGTRCIRLGAGTVNITGCTFANAGAGIYVADPANKTINIGGICTLNRIYTDGTNSASVAISGGASINLASSIAPGGTGGITVLTGGCTVNGNAIPAGTYTSIDSNGQPT